MIWSPVAEKTRIPPPTSTVPAGQPAVAGVWEAARFVTVCVTAATCTEIPAASAGVGGASHGIETANTIAAMPRLTDAIPGLIGHSSVVLHAQAARWSR